MPQEGQPFIYSSPALNANEADRMLYECPVGYLLRESPHTYDTIDVCSLSENMGPTEFLSTPRYFQLATRVYRSEISRLQELREHNRKIASDAKYAAQRLKAGH